MPNEPNQHVISYMSIIAVFKATWHEFKANITRMFY